MRNFKKKRFEKKKEITRNILTSGNFRLVRSPEKTDTWNYIKDGELPDFDEVVIAEAIHEGERYFGFFKRLEINDDFWKWGISNKVYVTCSRNDEFEYEDDHTILKWKALKVG